MNQAKAYKLVPVTMFNRLMNNQRTIQNEIAATPLEQMMAIPASAPTSELNNIVQDSEKNADAADEYEPLLELLPKVVRNKARISLKLIWHKLIMDRNSLRLRSKNGELSSHIVDVLYWCFATGVVAPNLERPIEGPNIIRLMHDSGVPNSFYKNRLSYLKEGEIEKGKKRNLPMPQSGQKKKHAGEKIKLLTI
jgi:hypothetical protein